MVTVSGIRRQLRPLTDSEVGRVPAQLGVFEIVDAAGTTVLIGQAGGQAPFGLRGALSALTAHHGDASFRYECTHAYRSRWQELLMLHRHLYSEIPAGNHGDAHLLGQLS